MHKKERGYSRFCMFFMERRSQEPIIALQCVPLIISDIITVRMESTIVITVLSGTLFSSSRPCFSGTTGLTCRAVPCSSPGAFSG
jgi:hypothetical protein